MNDELMQPFVQATVEAFDMMLGIPLDVETIESHFDERPPHDVSGIIGLGGSCQGTLVVSMPAEVACKAISLMLDEPIQEVDQEVCDGIGEIVNIIAGAAKKGLGELGFAGLALSMPSVIVGQHRTVWCSRDLPCRATRLCAPDLGSFFLEVQLRRAETGGARDVADAAAGIAERRP